MASEAYQDLGPAPSATGSTKRSVPPPIKRIVGELGLRFRPASNAAMEDHRRACELLASDLFDVPPAALEAAAKEWIGEKSFMPRAADLVALARKHDTQPTRRREEILRERVEFGNAHLREIGRDHELRWSIENGQAVIGWK